MRGWLLPLVALILTSTAAPAAGTAAAEVTLRVGTVGMVVPSHWLTQNDAVWIHDPAQDTSLNGLAGVAGCTLTVADANGDGRISGLELLGAATAAGCITGYAVQDFGFGAFVTMVDGLEQAGGGLAAWWLVQVNLKGSLIGVSDLDLQSGDAVDFVYYLGPL
jgi:hypothetical protein